MNNIQKKFLVSTDIKRWLEKQISTLEKTEQFYVYSTTDEGRYYLKIFPDAYFKVSKVTVDTKVEEVRVVVNEEVYLEARQKHLGRKVVKKSYKVQIAKETFVLYEYVKKLKGLYVLVASFDDEKALRSSQTLETLHSFVLKEIDQDKKYHDKALALYDKPMEYNLDKLFEKIDAFESANLFFWQVPRRIYVRDGVVLILYKNLRLIHHYKVNFQRKHLSATLHRLRVLMRRTATLMDTFSDLFNPNVKRFCVEMLLRYHEETKILRYLYFLEELCSTRQEAKLSLYSELKTLIANEEKEVTQMLLSKPFSQLIQIMTRELYEKGYEQYYALKKEVKSVVEEKLKIFEEQLQQTKEGFDEEILDAMYHSMDALQILLEDFFHIIGEKETQILVDEINILLKPLREYRNCKQRAMILEAIKTQSQNSILEIEPLLCEHEEKLKKKIEKALQLLRTSKFYV